MANFKHSFELHKAIFFQMQLHCFLSDMRRVAALAYHVVTPAFFCTHIATFGFANVAYMSAIFTNAKKY